MCCRVIVVCVLIILGRSVIMIRGVQFEFVIPVGMDFELQSAASSLSAADNKLKQLWLTPNPDIAEESGVAQKNAVGRVVYNNPIPLFNQSSGQVVSFNTSFTFIIRTPCGYDKCGDGLAFSISPFHELPPDSTGGSLGILSHNNTPRDRQLFAVEFDTYLNPPLSDPSASHIGIDVNWLTSVATFDSSDPHSDLYLYKNYTISAWVEYIAPQHLTQVFASNSSHRPSQPCVKATHDLSDIFDPKENFYAAISATSDLQGAALLYWNFTSLPSASSPRSRSTQLAFHLTLSLLGVGLLLAAAAGTLVYKRRKQLRPAMIEMIPSSTGSVPRQYSYRELKKATQGFSDKQKVGEGGFSSVYKGTLSTGRVVAVKRLKEMLKMEVQFVSEIQIINRIRHRNLLQLQGWAYKKGEALLVYEYMTNGSLDSYLFGKKRGHPELMNGEKRLGILVGVAAALEYLHEGLGECVLHRDVKAANVMLTESFEAILGDFGLARLITHNQGAVTMTVAGTPGYVAPEVVHTGRATNKADVYSFGMLALEVACGRRAWNASLPPEEAVLLEWVWLLQQSGKVTHALDPACYLPAVTSEQHIQAEAVANYMTTEDGSAEQIVIEEAHKSEDDSLQQEIKWRCVLHLGLLCCMPWPEDRPTMRQVHQALRESSILPLPSTRPTYTLFGFSSHSASTSMMYTPHL